MKIIIEVPDNTSSVMITSQSFEQIGGNSLNVHTEWAEYGGEPFQSMVVLEPCEDEWKLACQKKRQNKEQSTALDCGVTQGRCTFDEGGEL